MILKFSKDRKRMSAQYDPREIKGARRLLRKMVPFEVWLAESPRTYDEIQAYWKLVDELKTIITGEVPVCPKAG